MNVPLGRVAALLLGSGACALVYQVVWLRELRLVFGGSTAASAAVLAIFTFGLGAGARVLGPRADSRRVPLAFYARLETLVALLAAATPLLLELVRAAYLALGGSERLGLGLGTVMRLALSAVVLGLPTFLMGGTLPAAVRAAETEGDARRRRLAVLYGANTLGAVLGAFLATFVLIEALGNRAALWLACALNLAVALLARRLARGERAALPASERPTDEHRAAAAGYDRLSAAALPPPEASARAGGESSRPETAAGAAVAARPEARARATAPPGFVLGAALVTGLVFFLMEMVWYRMLSPLLGGSVFTFGLILSGALLGIGVGGLLHAFVAEGRPATLHGFAATCLLEALSLGAAYALGDRLALLALALQPLASFGFGGQVLSWSAVCAIVVLPASLVAGFQFPLLVALLGRGREAVGRQLGQAYAWNTAGAILGSLLGGFGLLPLLGAPGCWLLSVLLLVALGSSALVLALRREGRPWQLVPQAALALLAIQATQALGPTAAWRHSGIGAGRASASALGSRNGIVEFLHQERRLRHWETEGVESSVALVRRSGMAFAVNGKIDGHFTLDAPTQVMGGLLAAALHERPRSALVVGLGTGSSAGWLGAVPEIERVDVVELERGTLEVARAASAVNLDVLRNPRVRILFGDARELVQTSRFRYDVVFSEPSNPFRAGIASLFTREFYAAASERLAEDGIFVQWVQAYEVGGASVRAIYATLSGTFPEIETWRTHRDLLLLATRRPRSHSAGGLRARLARAPFRQALLSAWRVDSLEGFLGYFVGRPELARGLAATADPNSDDRNRLEFGFARSVGRRGQLEIPELQELARARGEDRPAGLLGAVDWTRVDDERRRLSGPTSAEWPRLTEPERARAAAYAHYQNGDLAAALAAWRSQERPPASPTELGLAAEGLADEGHSDAERAILALRGVQEAEADVALARLRQRQGRLGEAAAATSAALERHQRDPWPRPDVLRRGLALARELAFLDPGAAPRLVDLLSRPFAAWSLDEERRAVAFEIAARLNLVPQCARAAAAFEPWVPWRREFLRSRLACYEAASDPRAAGARADLAAFESAELEPLMPSASTR